MPEEAEDHGEGEAGDDPGAGRHRRGGRHLVAVAVGAGLVVLVAVAAVIVTGGGGGDDEPAAATPEEPPSTEPEDPATSTTAPPAAAPASSTIATSRVADIQAFAEPAEDAQVVATLADETDYGAPRTFLVVEERDQWLKVLLPIRPNGSSGWVRAGDVTTAVTTFAIRIEVGAHHVTFYDGGRPFLESGAVVGDPETPTPTGRFFVTDPVDLSADPGGPYGAFAYGLSGYSDVLYEFAGGPGQLALHGTNRPDQLGQEISNGCIRIPDDVILQLVERLPLGTPVEIVA